MPNRSDARGAIHIRTTIISDRFAGMNRHADTNRHMNWPRFFSKCALNFEGRGDSIAPARKNCEHTVAFAALQNNRAIMRFDFSRHDLIMPLQRSACFRRIRIPRPARPFHISEQKSYRPDRSVLHHTDYELTPDLKLMLNLMIVV